MVMSPILPRSARHPGRHVLAALALMADAGMVLAKAFQDFTWLKNSRPFTVKSSLWNLILILFKYFIYIFNTLQDIKYKDLL